ncbi:calsyntenin-1 isoform X1 [Brachionus plicatilis]|uniref:Calsyntenin-1 isoform X1 n=1 Tax=Brachionus plicatilis TaxID=10195 RepID=A0A3M7T1M0_BRAPC|nr:calsyntenin-1 isoform X1 [Brachionus plicatilis]
MKFSILFPFCMEKTIIPVKIQVIDHDDYELKFEHDGVHTATLTESNEIYQNFMSVRARDNDCTNDGYACSYQLLTESLIPVEPLFPIKIDNTGVLSTLRSVKRAESFDFIVRAFDCLNNQSHTDAKVLVTVVEPCTPEWTNYHNEILSEAESTKLFAQLDSTECTQANILHKQDSECVIDSVTAKLSLHLDPSIQNNCKKCAEAKKLTLFNGGLYTSDDSIEDQYEDELNQILPVKQKSGQEPVNFQTFSKSSANWKKIDFDGAFGNQFNLSAWIRRPSSADKTLKEQVLCGTDSKSLNRHHFGLYFYRGNLKFLLRREPSEHKELKQDLLNQDSSNIDSNEAFYPSLWEWSVVSDSKWHLYEVRFSYPNASLFIDGVRYAENNTNKEKKRSNYYVGDETLFVKNKIKFVGLCGGEVWSKNN